MADIGRREALRSGLGGLLGVAGAVASAACRREARAYSCCDPAALSDEDRQQRGALGYVESSPVPGQDCAGCHQFIAAPSPGPPRPLDGACGGCRLLKGPIHPRGYCRVFAARS